MVLGQFDILSALLTNEGEPFGTQRRCQKIYGGRFAISSEFEPIRHWITVRYWGDPKVLWVVPMLATLHLQRDWLRAITLGMIYGKTTIARWDFWDVLGA